MGEAIPESNLNSNISPEYRYTGAAHISRIMHLPLDKKVKEMEPRQISAIQIVLYKWLMHFSYYKKRQFLFTDLFNNGSYDPFTAGVLVAFSKCYDLFFDGKITQGHKIILEKIARGLFGCLSDDYAVKSGYGENVYNYINKHGAAKIPQNISKKHPMCRTYQIGQKYPYVKLLKTVLNCWLLRLKFSSPKKYFTLNADDKTFCKQTYAAMCMLNACFNLNIAGNVISRIHLPFFKKILAAYDEKDITKDYSSKTNFQKTAYKLIQNEDPVGALERFRAFKHDYFVKLHRKKIINLALALRGKPYHFGGAGLAGFDCSGFTQYVFEKALGVKIRRSADEQYYQCGKKIAQNCLLPGDLVFFQTYRPGISHVGIYKGGGEFIHASSSRGVTVSKLNEPYWSQRYITAGRYIA